MVAQAQRLFPALEFVVGDMLDLPFADASVDALVSFYSIVNFDEEQTRLAIGEMARVLVPAGLLALAFHIGTDVVHHDEWFGEPVSIDFSLHETASVSRDLLDAGLALDSLEERDPFPPPIEVQNRRCYIVASRG